MENDNYRPITFARFINLIEDLSTLEDLLRYFENEEAMQTERNRNTLEPIIAELLQYSAMYRRAIRAHLEECREWDAFPDEFWNAINVRNITCFSERYPCDSDLFTQLAFVTEEIQCVARTAENCLRDYQYSGYIEYQPVAIDLLDCLIDINSHLRDVIHQIKNF